MAKAPKQPEAAPAKKSNLPVHEKPEFGVAELAEALGIEPTSARVKLRNAGIEKTGRSYSWKNQKELDAVVKQLKATPDKPAKDAKPADKPAETAPKKAPPKKK